MRFHFDCLPALAFGLLCGFLTLPALAVPQTANHRRPPQQYTDQGAIPMPPDRSDDSYAIYSLLMPGQPFAQMPADQTSHWAIATVTVNADDRNPAVPPQGQLKPPPDHAREFQEAVRDYEVNQYVRVQLTREAFRITHDFSLLSPDQIAALRGAGRAQGSGYPGITYFSEVYFDQEHDAALVYMNDWCAHLCASGTWVYLEKHGGQWVRRSGIVVPGV